MNTENLPRWMQDSALVKRARSVRQSVELHKWYESEKAGHDIGWHRAVVGWTFRADDRETSR